MWFYKDVIKPVAGLLAQSGQLSRAVECQRGQMSKTDMRVIAGFDKLACVLEEQSHARERATFEISEDNTSLKTTSGAGRLAYGVYQHSRAA
jgi:hypothetical protein